MTTYDNWDAQTTELQNKHGYKGVSQGALAKVSIYEFVNDWLRPEISFKIFSYMRDPHKTGVCRSLRNRRVYTTSKKYINSKLTKTKKKWRWVEDRVPYAGLPLYRQINTLRPKYNDGQFNNQTNWHNGRQNDIMAWGGGDNYNSGDYSIWGREGQGGRPGVGLMERQFLKHTNKLLQELWSFRITRLVNGGEAYVKSKKDLHELCKINKVNGRTKLFKVVATYRNARGYKIPQDRKPIITALMKL